MNEAWYDGLVSGNINNVGRAIRFFWLALPYRCKTHGYNPLVVLELAYDSLFN